MQKHENIRTWNHLACRRAAKACKHFSLSKTSFGSDAVFVAAAQESIHGDVSAQIFGQLI